MTVTITGADVFNPQAATDTMQAVASVYADLLASIEQTHANQVAQGVSGAPLDMLTTMFEEASIVAAAAQKSADEFARHTAVVADTIGSDPSLAGTQAGGYMDPAAL